MKVYFENNSKRERLIGEGETQEECDLIITKFLEEHNFVPYYSRQWNTDKGLKIDVGSYAEFFYIRTE